MPKIDVDVNEVVEFLMEYAEVDALKEEIGRLRGIDWNPFNEDEDEYVGVWAELQHNYELIHNVAVRLITTVEKLVVGGLSLSNQQKHKAVVSALDRAVRAPFYLEPFDGPLFDMLVAAAVSLMNRVNWGMPEGQKHEMGSIIVERQAGRLVAIGTT